MKYLSKVFGEDVVEELTKERARFLLEGCYKKEAVDDIFENGKAFRLETMTRIIWTKNDDGQVPMPGFYGIVGK